MVEIGAGEGACLGRIVFEDKDRRLSKNAMREELNGALAERQADFAVLVVAGEERIPAGHEELSEYEGNKLIVAVDPEEPDALGLALAYRYARLRVLMARDSHSRSTRPASAMPPRPPGRRSSAPRPSASRSATSTRARRRPARASTRWSCDVEPSWPASRT